MAFSSWRRAPSRQRDVRRRRRWLAPALAVAALLVAALIVARHDVHHPASVVAARLLGADGTAVGQVLVSADPDRMVCVLDGAPAGARYDVAVTAGGRVVELGSYTSPGPGRPWTADLPVDPTTVRWIVIRDGDGHVRARADLGGQ
jgi:hypothetical protein